MKMIEQNFGKLNIVLAVYGLKRVTQNVKNLITDAEPQSLSFSVTNKVIGQDGWVGQKKSIMILYNYDDGDMHLAAAKEGGTITINPDTLTTSQPVYSNAITNNSGLTVLAAAYGPQDVTQQVRNLLSPYKAAYFRIDNTSFADSWYGVAKTLVVVLGTATEVWTVEVFTERESCYIDLNDKILAY